MAYSINAKDHFNTKLYTGNATGRTISGVGFQPDWSWIKNRSDTSGHRLLDAVRGATKELISNANNAEATEAQSLQSWNSDGFVLGTAAGVNANTNNFVSWNWKANGQGSSNTAGTINSTYTSANTTSGFSIVSYTGNGSAGATVGHGLGQTPACFITKRLSGTSSWGMYHQSTGAGGFMELNSSNALQSNTAYFNNTAPTSSVFSIGTDSINNTSGSTYIAYCFAEKTGFSKFGKYLGNGDANGSFIYTGFKPAMLIIKCSDTDGEHYHIHDTKRQTYNVDNRYLLVNTADAESTSSSYAIDILSNGFKARTTNNSTNGTAGGSGRSYIYLAFAEAPLVGSNNVPANAR
tara:strand:- start:10 stop:1059 length:1050 start_codon:yes stop_codon:yes gene_type:complete